MTTLKVIAIPGLAQAGGFSGPNTGTVAAGSDGTFTIDVRDVPFAYGAGYVPARTDHRFYTTPVAVAAASAGLLFASAALSNGTKAIAANVDVMREVKAVVLPGTTAITAGTLTLTYDANDGTAAQVDALDLTTALSTTKTLAASKGVMRMRSQIVTGLTGGTSPTFYIGTTAAIAVPVSPGAQNAAIVSEFLDSAIVTVANAGTLSTAGIYAPNSAPNATLKFGVSYNTIAQ
jgi:hypothetical protein